MRSIFLPLISLSLMLGSCSSPPKPPNVDESTRRPANSALAIDLQTCKSDLHNVRIVARETERTAETNTANEARVSALQRAIASVQARLTAPSPEAANSIFTIHFDFGSARVVISDDLRTALIESARAAPLVFLRGRTDGVIDTVAESRIASARAAAVRDYLVSVGVDANRIRVSHQSVGDHVSDNQTSAGRALNRRVEIEVYRAAPVALR